jgi:pimeloyl-ACP methyl ester carboxylesterase
VISQPSFLGHSIGGMITLTFCRLFPQALGGKVRAIALVQTTYTNPVRTTTMAVLFTALERPVIVPLLHLTIWLSPLDLVVQFDELSEWLCGMPSPDRASGFFLGVLDPAEQDRTLKAELARQRAKPKKQQQEIAYER